jgi:hypothetical protein
MRVTFDESQSAGDRATARGHQVPKGCFRGATPFSLAKRGTVVWLTTTKPAIRNSRLQFRHETPSYLWRVSRQDRSERIAGSATRLAGHPQARNEIQANLDAASVYRNVVLRSL